MVTYCVTYLKHVFAPCLYSFSYPPSKGAAHLNCLCKEDLSSLSSKSNEVPSRYGSKKFNRTLLCQSRQFPLKFTLLNLERSINAESATIVKIVLKYIFKVKQDHLIQNVLVLIVSYCTQYRSQRTPKVLNNFFSSFLSLQVGISLCFKLLEPIQPVS